MSDEKHKICEREMIDLLDERDRRYAELRAADQESLKLALNSQEKAVAAALAAADRAVSKADFATEKRFDAVNEFRATLSDQAAHLMPTDIILRKLFSDPTTSRRPKRSPLLTYSPSSALLRPRPDFR